MDTQFAAVRTVPYWPQPATGCSCVTRRTAAMLPTAAVRPDRATLRLFW